MKSKIFILTCLFFVLLQVPVVHAAGPYVYDKTVPKEKSSILRITSCAITQFNGKKTGSQWNALLKIKEVQILAGEHRMQVYQEGGSFNTVTRNTVDGTFNFLPGHTYIVFLGTVYQGAKLQIVDVTMIDEDPVPDPSSTEATILEGVWVNTADETHQLIFFKNQYAVKAKGQFTMRGPFSFDDKNIALTIVYRFDKGKWIMLAVPLGPARATYSGEIITMPAGKNKVVEFKKVD